MSILYNYLEILKIFTQTLPVLICESLRFAYMCAGVLLIVRLCANVCLSAGILKVCLFLCASAPVFMRVVTYVCLVCEMRQ